ncbi:hypothetical protein ZWY2020_037094 [Hordeum vulgare]|nr:hypothetical protein ZWY2020_037094 [Hordeum vulgare]
MSTSPLSSFFRLDYRSIIFSTNIAAAGRGIRFRGHLLVTQSEDYLSLSGGGFLLRCPCYSHSPRSSRSSLRAPSLLLPLLLAGPAALTMTKATTNFSREEEEGGLAAAGTAGGWIHRDFLPSTVTADDLLELVEHGMIANKSWRLPAEGETEPAPQ